MITFLRDKKLPTDCYVFKHSTQCLISEMASHAVENYEFELPLYWISVIEDRPISNWVAESYKIPHQSPQLIEIRKSVVQNVLNHSAIKRQLTSK